MIGPSLLSAVQGGCGCPVPSVLQPRLCACPCGLGDGEGWSAWWARPLQKALSAGCQDPQDCWAEITQVLATLGARVAQAGLCERPDGRHACRVVSCLLRLVWGLLAALDTCLFPLCLLWASCTHGEPGPLGSTLSPGI